MSIIVRAERRQVVHRDASNTHLFVQAGRVDGFALVRPKGRDILPEHDGHVWVPRINQVNAVLWSGTPADGMKVPDQSTDSWLMAGFYSQHEFAIAEEDRDPRTVQDIMQSGRTFGWFGIRGNLGSTLPREVVMDWSGLGKDFPPIPQDGSECRSYDVVMPFIVLYRATAANLDPANGVDIMIDWEWTLQRRSR